MRTLSNQEMLDIKGGAVKMGVVAGVAAGIAFVIGILDGLMRPIKCR